MAELSVRANYRSNFRDLVMGTLRMTFPLWGVVGPIAAGIIVLWITYSLAFAWYIPKSREVWIAAIVTMSSLAVSVACLTLTSWLSKDVLLLDRDGIRFPLVLTFAALLGGHLPWESIGKIKIHPDDTREWKRKKLLFFKRDGSTIGIDLGRMKPDELEQVLLAVNMWGIGCERDASIETLRNQVKEESAAVHELSYTQMWEDELRRRFCPTAFIPLEPGQVLRDGALKVVRQLAMGGLSAVYLCQKDGSKLVVLKEAVVPEDSPEHLISKSREMFEREARLLIKLQHPAIVQVLDFFVESGRHYLMLEYLGGQDLRQFLNQNGPQREHVVLEWGIQIATILKYLHEQDPPIVHRDLTPDNLVIRDDGTLALIDFGAANEFIGNATGTFVGKQSFIAPEQFRGKAVVQSDIYSFGCTLYCLLTGNEPEALCTSSPKEVNPEISNKLNEIVVTCTQIEPRDRFQSAAGLIPVLRQLSASFART